MEKYIKVTFNNGEEWEIPAWVIAMKRALSIADSTSKNITDAGYIYEREYDLAMDKDLELIEWADKLRWEDVAHYAIRMHPNEVSYKNYLESGWKGYKRVVIR